MKVNLFSTKHHAGKTSLLSCRLKSDLRARASHLPFELRLDLLKHNLVRLKRLDDFNLGRDLLVVAAA